MTDKMPDKVFVREYQNISVHNNRGWGESPSLTDAAIEAQYIHADLHAKQMEFLAGWIHGLTGKSVEEILALAESPIVEVEV